MKYIILTILILLFLLFEGCATVEENNTFYDYNSIRDDKYHRKKADEMEMRFVDYMHMINTGKKQENIKKSIIQYKH